MTRSAQDDEFFLFCVSLRAALLEQITGIENAGFSLYWDNSSPNSLTRRKLEALYEIHLTKAAAHGVYVVTRHSDCGRRKHKDYVMSNPYGLDLKYKDSRFVWPGGQMYQGKRMDVCPCNTSGELSEHWVIEDVIYDPQKDQKVCDKIERVLSDIHDAIQKSRDNRPRSAIREYLLRAVIQLNDLILPLPVDEYIAARIPETK